jgi:hypothetical protein
MYITKYRSINYIHDYEISTKICIAWEERLCCPQEDRKFLSPIRKLKIVSGGGGGTNPIILHDNARAHTANTVKGLFCCWQWEILEHPPHSPDMSPCDYDLFTKMKEPL